MRLAGILPRLEASADAVLRSRTIRYAGWVAGLAGIAFLVRALVTAGDAGVGWFAAAGPGAVAAAAAGFAVYQLGSIVTLRLLYGRPALTIWGVSQVVKYLPVPGSAAVGMVGGAVRGGGSTRDGVALTLRHTLVHVGAATVLGGLALASALAGLVPPLLTLLAAGAAGLLTAALGVRHLRLPVRAGVVGLAVATWLGLGLLLWVGVALGEGAPLRVAGAFAAGWVAGQIVLPAPAGLGVREVALALLLTPVLGEVEAVSFALATRVLHVASDAAVAALVGARGGWGTLRQATAAGLPDDA